MTDTPLAAEAESQSTSHPWAELPLEQATLLRLAPLPTDAFLGARPLRFVEVRQAERHSAEESLLRLVIQVPGNLALRGRNTLEIWANHARRSIHLGPTTGVTLDLPGRGLGRFLLAQGVAWAKQHWADYAVDQGPLQVAGIREAERSLRDHCLLAQGFAVQYPEDSKLKPFFSAPSLTTLNTDWNREKVQIVSLADAATMLEQANQCLLEQEAQIRQVQERAARYQREDGTLRFTIICLVMFSLFQAGLLIWIATR